MGLDGISGLGHKRFSFAFAWLLGLTLTTGCGVETGGRVPVAGSVTLNGDVLDEGTIEFHPMGEGMITGGMIRDGRFEIPADRGAMPGQYAVRIYSTREPGESAMDPDAPPGDVSQAVGTELIDERYNVASELTAQIDQDGASDLQFNLEQ